MFGKLKELLSDWKVTVALVGGALVVGSTFGTCTLDPEVSAADDVEESSETESEDNTVDVSSEGETTGTSEATTTPATDETTTE